MRARRASAPRRGSRSSRSSTRARGARARPRRAPGTDVPSYPLRALVLRKTKLGEADLILTLLADDGRQVRAVAKGARKTKSRIGARAEPFTVLDLLLHEGRTLEVIGEAEIVASNDRIRQD